MEFAKEMETKTKRGRHCLKHPLLTGDKDEERRNLKILLIKNNVSIKQVAKELGMTLSGACGAINRHYMSTKVLNYLHNLPIQLN